MALNKSQKNLLAQSSSYRTNANSYPSSVGTTYKTTNTSSATPYFKSGINVNVDKRFQAPSGYVNNTSNSLLGKSSSGSSSKSKTTNSGSYGAYMQLAAAQAAANQQRALEAANAMKAMAQSAYDKGMSNLNSAYDARLKSLAENLGLAQTQLKNAYDSSAKAVNQDADRSLKQAYVNQMLNKKNLNQQLSSQGLSGGASESTMARLYNNYGNSRNSIEGTRADNLGELNNTYNTNLAEALSAYNTAVADADSQRMQYINSLESALANGQISAEQNYQDALNSNNSAYMSALSNALDQMNEYGFTPSEVLNDIQLANVIQNAFNTSSNYKNAVNQGASANGVTNSTLSDTDANNYLAAVLKSLYNL